MSIQAYSKLAITALVLGYPLLAHWALPLLPVLPPLLLTLWPALLDLWLAWLFGSTLRSGRVPLIAIFARLERTQLLDLRESELPPDIARYTRALTRIWSTLFLAMAAVALLLALAAKTAWWLLFTGAISYGCVSVLFLGEYFYRRRRFSGQQHAHPLRLAWLLFKSGPIWLRQAQ